eukprot:5995858-Ditylum_brightwellii.AAC.1
MNEMFHLSVDTVILERCSVIYLRGVQCSGARERPEQGEIEIITTMSKDELYIAAKELCAPYELAK